MPGQVNANYSANYQKFVDFANKAYAPNGKGEDTVARFAGMPVGDYKGTFASFWRTSDMKTANDQVRDLFRKTIADMFGGERNIPDIVRDNMKLEDFNKGKPLTARRINLVRVAIDSLGGGKFTDPASIGRATAMGYVASELPKLARVANIYQQATGCTNAEAEAAALDPNSKARRLYDYGGRFTQNVEGFKKGLALIDDFKTWFTDVCAAKGTGPGVTVKNFSSEVPGLSAMYGAEKFIFEELAVNEGIALDAQDKEAVFGMERNPASRFVLRGFAHTQYSTLAQMPSDKRQLLYAVNDLFHPLALDGKEGKRINQGGVFIGRVMKHAGELAALKAAGNLTRQAAFDILFSDIPESEKGARDAEASNYLEDMLVERLPTAQIIRAVSLLVKTGASVDEVVNALENNTTLPRAPHMADIGRSINAFGMKGEGGIKSMRDDIYRPSMPTLMPDDKEIVGVRNRYVFKFADETLECGGTTEEAAMPVMERISSKLRELCTAAHPEQLDMVAYSLGQGPLGSLQCLSAYGINANEHIPVEYTISKNQETGAITIAYKEPENFTVKFNWTVTVNVDGSSTSTPMRLDHGQYEAEAMKHVDEIARKAPSKDKAATEKLIKEMLAYCGDDFDLKDVVSRRIANICITATSQVRSPEKIKEKIDAIADNFRELRKLSKDNPSVYEAGRRMMVALDGKALPPGMIAKLVLEASNAKIDAIRKLSPRSSALEIHHAISQFSENIVTAMNLSEAEAKTDGANEKQACRNFIAAVMIDRCGDANALRAMQGAFAGDKPGKMLSLYESVVNSQQNEGVEQRLVIPFENLASNHMMNIANLKGAIDVALDGDFGDDIVPFNGEFNADEINADEILDDLLNLASR